jgi:hypothetical protein
LVIAVYISGHGFGHAARAVELVGALRDAEPDASFIVRTAVTRAMLEPLARERVELQHAETDTGLTQRDSLTIDEEDSARTAAHFYATFDRRAADEAARLRASRVDLVLGDIPPLAFAAAARAGIRSVAVGNFTWDWIYSVYPAFDALAPGVIPVIRDAYAHATRALRLPLHGGFAPMAAVTVDIPFIARQSTRDRAEPRRAAGVDGSRPVVLPSFGAYGAALPYDIVRRQGRLTVLDPKRVPAGFSYQDLVAAADVVVTKPGYGIVSECAANDTPLLYTSRGRFIEYDVFVAEMPRILRCKYISQEDLLAGKWADAVGALLAQPAPPERARIDGAGIAAGEILRMRTC